MIFKALPRDECHCHCHDEERNVQVTTANLTWCNHCTGNSAARIGLSR